MPALQRSSLLFLAAWVIALGGQCASEVGAGGNGEQGDQPTKKQSSFSFTYPLPISAANPSAIACIKRLPDGAAVCINRKCVTRVATDHLYIEEADRSSGVKVLFAGFYPPVELAPGNLASFAGQVGTVGGERVIYCRSEFDCDLTMHATIMPLGMVTPAILGWPVNPNDPQGTRVRGLMPTGLVVKISGRVSASNWADEDGYFIYIDDGYGKKDGSEIGATGVRVYSNLMPPIGGFLVAAGVLSTRWYDPDQGSTGDEFAIPAIRCNYDQDPYFPIYQPQTCELGQVSGLVRLVGEASPGRDVRVYSQNDSVIMHNVTDEFKPFTLRKIPPIDLGRVPPLAGGVITASAAGVISDSRNAAAGATDVVFELMPSTNHVEIKSDKDSISICSSDQAVISAMLRDCEGKGIAGRQLKLTTTKGSFVEAPTHPAWIVKTTDSSGFVVTPLVSTPDNSGVAVITAKDQPDEMCTADTSVILRGPDVTVTASPRFLTAGGASAVSAQVTDGGEPTPNAAVTFKTDYGVFQQTGSSSYSTQADLYGIARATLVLTSPGTARVLAVYTNACSQETLGWTVVAYKTSPWYSQGVQYSHPLVVDLDGDLDGKKEVVIVTATGYLTVLRASGAIYWSKVTHLPGNNTVSCAVLDAERSGRPCLFVPAESQQKLYAFAYNGNPLAGWPAGTNYRFIRAAAAIGDINLDGTPEMVAGDECCYVFAWNPTGDWKKTGSWDSSFLWRNLTESSSTTIYNTTCALGDVVNDPVPPVSLNVVVGSNHSAALFGFPADLWGDFANSPAYLDGYPKSAGARVETSAAIGDIDGDGKNDVAVGSDDGNLYILSSKNGTWRGYPTGGMVRSSPAMCDLDGDGNLDAVIVGSDSGRLFAFNYLGQAPTGWDQGIKLNGSAEYPIESSPVVADVNGDGRVEVVVGCNDGNLYAVYADGLEHRQDGVPTGPLAWARCCVPTAEATAQILTAPVTDDIDNDGKFEVLAAGDKGVYIFHFNAPYDPQNQAQHPWPTFHANNQRTGCAAPAPAPVKASIQGIVSRAGQPVLNAKVYIWGQDGSPVIVPHSDPPISRGYVLTVGTTDPTELGKGAYCISQIEPKTVYKLKVEAPGVPDPVWVENIAVTTGNVIVDVIVP